MKKISLKGFAQIMLASPARQRTLLRYHKYPSEDEPRARILYYRDARDRIIAYHSLGHDPEWLVDEARALERLASASVGPRKTRLNHNGRALRAYAKHFASRNFEILDDVLFNLVFGDVQITVRPDLHVVERNKEKLIKLEFGVVEPSGDEIKIISQAMFEAAEQEGMKITAASILLLDVPRGVEHKGARMGSRRRRDIEATCQIIDAIWDGL
jgi:hypothetical protein